MITFDKARMTSTRWSKDRRYVVIGATLVVLLMTLSSGRSIVSQGWRNIGYVQLIEIGVSLPKHGAVTLLRQNTSAHALDNAARYSLQEASAIDANAGIDYGQGLVNLWAGDYKTSIKAMESAAKERGDLAVFFEGQSHYYQGDQDKAVDVWRQSPSLLVGLRGQAKYLLGLGRLSEALDVLSTIAVIDHQSRQSWVDIGEIYVNLGDWANARNAYEKALEIEPDDIGTALMLVKVKYYLDGDADIAERTAREILSRFGPDKRGENGELLYDNYMFLGDLAIKIQRYEQAVEWYAKAIDVPQVVDRWAMVAMAQVYQSMGDEKSAIDWINKSLLDGPGSASVYSSLGHILWSQGNLVDAEQAFRQAISINPHDLRFQIAYGAFLAETGRREAASSVFNTVLRMDPGNQSAQAWVERIVDYSNQNGQP